MALAAAEAAVGLALVISIYRHKQTSNLDEVKELRG
jgi:NADH-quinone oxidoreductase subunit K